MSEMVIEECLHEIDQLKAEVDAWKSSYQAELRAHQRLLRQLYRIRSSHEFDPETLEETECKCPFCSGIKLAFERVKEGVDG